MKGNNKKIVEKTKQQQSEEVKNNEVLNTAQWEDEQLEIFSDIIIAVLIKESLNNHDDATSDI